MRQTAGLNLIEDSLVVATSQASTVNQHFQEPLEDFIRFIKLYGYLLVKIVLENNFDLLRYFWLKLLDKVFAISVDEPEKQLRIV